MKVYNDPADTRLTPGIERMLARYRLRRGLIDIDSRARELRAFFDGSRLTAAVVGVSGGVDSAVVVALLARAGIPTVGLLMPGSGTTDQEQATRLGREVCSRFGASPLLFDVSAVADLIGEMGEPLGLVTDPWARGQLVSNSRTPVAYHAATLLHAAGKPAVVVGTMNRTEYRLGYWGKANDGMVDVQPIANWYKKEVQQAGEFLGVPTAVLQATPKGDVFDGRTDEQIFGASYDFAEFYLESKKIGFDEPLGPAETEQFDRLSSRLEALIEYNAHKLAVGSPAHWIGGNADVR